MVGAYPYTLATVNTALLIYNGSIFSYTDSLGRTVLQTGGTAVAACNLVRKAGADVVAAAFIIELDPLKGREKIEAKGVEVVSMLNYDLD